MQKNQRVAILIDFPNIGRSVYETFGSRVNVDCFHEQAGDRQETRAIAYVTNGENAQKFHHVLKQKNYELKIIPNNGTKVDCDVWLTVDAISISEKVDVIVIGSGDGDYVPLIHYLRAKGVRVEVMAVEKTTSYELIKTADAFVPITNTMTYNKQVTEDKSIFS